MHYTTSASTLVRGDDDPAFRAHCYSLKILRQLVAERVVRLTLESLSSWPWASGLYMGIDTWHTLRGCSINSAPCRDSSAIPRVCMSREGLRSYHTLSCTHYLDVQKLSHPSRGHSKKESAA